MNRPSVLGKATSRAAAALGLSDSALERVVGLGEPTVSRIVHGERGVDPAFEEGGLSLMPVRALTSPDMLVGSSDIKRNCRMTTRTTLP